jgi:hypothetical protein
MGQLAILAEKYGFDVNDARLTIGLPVSNRTQQTCVGGQCKVAKPPATSWMDKWPSVPQITVGGGKPVVPSKARQTATRVAKSGYNLYVTEAKDRVRADLVSGLNVGKGEKLGRGAVMAECGKRWRNLPECSRDLWNKHAAGSV